MRVKIWQAGTLTYTRGGLVFLFFWLLWGDFAWALRDRATPAILQVLLKKFEASDTLTGVCFGVLPQVLSTMIVPVVGYLSDRHRGRWGRRLPFLFFTVPFFVVSLVGLGFTPALGLAVNRSLGLHSPGLNTVTQFCLIGFWLLYDLATSVANPIFGGLVNDVVPAAVMGRFYSLFRALSLIAGMIFNFWIFGTVARHSTEVFLGLASIFGIGFSLMCWKVREGEYPAPPAHGEGYSFDRLLLGMKTFCVECYGKSFYLWFYAAFSFAWTASVPFLIFSYYYAKSLQIDDTTYGKYGALTLGISLVLAYPLGILADRFHPLRLGIAVQILYAVDLLLSAIFVFNAWTFGIALVVHGVIFGTWSTAVASISQRLMPKTKFAQYAAGGGIVGSLFSMVTAPLFGLILDHFHHHYRYTFLLGFATAVISIGLLLVVHRNFMACGGPASYVAPE